MKNNKHRKIILLILIAIVLTAIIYFALQDGHQIKGNK